MCACTSLSQDGFYQRGLWVASITYYGVVPPPFLTSKELFCARVVGEVSDFENEKYVVSYLLFEQGPASSLYCPAIFILECRSSENKFQLFASGANLSSASVQGGWHSWLGSCFSAMTQLLRRGEWISVESKLSSPPYGNQFGFC